MRQRRFADAWYVFDQQVATGQQARHRVLDLPAFADHDRANLVHQPGQLAWQVLRCAVLHPPHVAANG